VHSGCRGAKRTRDWVKGLVGIGRAWKCRRIAGDTCIVFHVVHGIQRDVWCSTWNIKENASKIEHPAVPHGPQVF